MIKPFENKKLLILGASALEIPLVKRAQELGAYVITTDYHTDFSKSPAKKVSDEYWNVSWADIDQLEKLCREQGINGVTAGYSELRVDNLISLCERLNLPCYLNRKQLSITRDKALFKAECRKNGVPTVKEYGSIDEVNRYPVIVKPTDRVGSIGVGIANNRQELEKAYAVALEKSFEKSIIIEDYITDATEFDAHYAIIDGKISLLCVDDILAARGNQKDGKVIQSAWIYPSRYEKDYLLNIHNRVEDMIRSMEIKTGTIFFSGFVNESGNFRFFECGYRLWGEQEFTYDVLCGKVNYLDIYIYYALQGNCSGISSNSCGNSDLKGLAINLYVTAGVIGALDGFDKIEKLEDCYLSAIESYLGAKCTADEAILTKAGMVGFSNTDPVALKEDVEKAYELLDICDEEGQDMLYEHIDPARIETWWDR